MNTIKTIKKYTKKFLPPVAVRYLRVILGRYGYNKIKNIKVDNQPYSKLISLSASVNLSEIMRLHKSNGKLIVLYLPWLAGQAPKTIAKLKNFKAISSRFEFIPIILPERPTDESIAEIKIFAKKNPELFFCEVKRILCEISAFNPILLFTQDWYYVQRMVLLAAKSSGIKTVLLPHEGVFFKKNKYYRSDDNLCFCPGADLVLPWNNLQKSIFRERGVPDERLAVVGSVAHSDLVVESKNKNSESMGKYLNITFVCQQMDMQVKKDEALEKQRDAIREVASICSKYVNSVKLTIRLPIHHIFSRKFIKEMKKLGAEIVDYKAVDNSWISKCDVVISHNSTALLEGVLHGALPISVRTFDFETILAKFDQCVVKSRRELNHCLEDIIEQSQRYGFQHVKSMFPIPEIERHASDYFGAFDAEKFVNIINNLNNNKSKVWENGGSDFGIFGNSYTSPHFKHLDHLVDLRLISLKKLSNMQRYLSNRHFVWGAPDGLLERLVENLSKSKGVNSFYLEDHPLQNRVSFNDPAKAIIITKKYPYFDARWLPQCSELFQPNLVGEVKKNIIKNRLTKYNFPKAINVDFSCKDKNKKIVFVDQREGDASLLHGGMDIDRYSVMADYIISKVRSGCLLYVKVHPDVSRGFSSLWSTRIGPLLTSERMHWEYISSNVNIVDCFDYFDNFIVATSGVGFEALLRNKNVTCFGDTFYHKYSISGCNVRSWDGIPLDCVMQSIFIDDARYICGEVACDASAYFAQ